MGVSLRSQQRLFKQLTGTTFQYLARFMRIEDLAQMVMRTYMNKQYGPGQAELAVNLGFSDQSHMAREVKRATGFTTGEAGPIRSHPDGRAVAGFLHPSSISSPLMSCAKAAMPSVTDQIPFNRRLLIAMVRSMATI